jgi:DNA-directed RNA polymerase subunit RPC12/RpoP
LAVRVCPHCKTELPAPEVAAHSNDAACPKCGARLEVTPTARTISSLCGLAVAAIVWHLSSGSSTDLGGVLPTVYAFLAFGIVSPLVLMFVANLRNAPAVAVAEPAHAPSSAGHGVAGGHGAGHH